MCTTEKKARTTQKIPPADQHLIMEEMRWGTRMVIIAATLPGPNQPSNEHGGVLVGGEL